MPIAPQPEPGSSPKKEEWGDRMVTATSETFRALGDPTRIRIVRALAGGERTVQSLSEEVGVSSSAISHQLRTLRQMGLVRVRREGAFAFYHLDDPHIEHLLSEAHRHVAEYLRHHEESSQP